MTFFSGRSAYAANVPTSSWTYALFGALTYATIVDRKVIYGYYYRIVGKDTFMRNLGFGELLVILLVVLLLFGAKRLPELARSLGRSLSEFKRGRDEGMKPDDSDTKKQDETNG